MTRFRAFFNFQLREKDRKPSRAELKILQLGSDSSLAFSMLEKTRNMLT